MARPCCTQPIAKIIRVADFEAGIVGLEEAFVNVCRGEARDEEQLKAELLSCAREFGNYISPSREADYQEALLREYKKFHAALHGTAKPTTASNRA
jgi:hypothetical protein